MLAGCSSTLLSPRHSNRLRSEASSQFQACHISTMSTQRLDLPRSFARKDASRAAQHVRPVGLSIEKPNIEAKTSGCSLRQNIKLPPTPTEGKRENKDDFWEQSSKRLKKKRFAGEEVSYDEEDVYANRVKRKRGNVKSDGSPKEEDVQHLSLGSESFWFHPGFNLPRSGPLIEGLSAPHPGPFSLSRSVDEEHDRVCFVPGNVIAPPLPPLSNIPWFDSVVTEITDFGKKNGGGSTIKCPDKEPSRSSSTSSDSRNLVLGLRGSNPVEHKVGNGSSPPYPSEGAEIAVPVHNRENNNNNEHECIELVNLLVACAEQIVSKNVAATNHCLARLGEIASPRGSPVHRLVAYFTEALALRAARLWPHIFHITAPRELDDESGTTLRLLNQVSPMPKFVHFTSNEILLRAFEGKDRVHIIDFDIKQGLQWPSLFQSLASRANPPSHVRITGIGESKQDLIETGDRLSGFAEALNLPFEFHLVVDRLEDVRLWMLHVKEHETVAVNCVFQLHKMLYDGTGGAIRDFMGLIRSTNAQTIVMTEQDAENNEARLDTRLCNSLRYYSAVFDSLDLSLPLDNPVRVKIEEMFGREIRNVIGCEGRDRFERHERFDKWRQVMELNGFRSVGISKRELLQGQMMLRMYGCENYKVEKREFNGAECVTLSWLDQSLYSVSAWTPVDVASCSISSCPQTS